jgi:DNA-binding winged helix-turn-helix (wHTH) protein
VEPVSVSRARGSDEHGTESVTILEWPEQADVADELRRLGRLRLFLVASDARPPDDWDAASDWLRRPADPEDILARVETLQRRAAANDPELRLDADGLLWRGQQWVPLAPVEIRIMTALLEEPSRVVTRAELNAAVWPVGAPGSRALDTRLKKLRVRVALLGLQIVNVRQRGFFLRWSESHTSDLVRHPAEVFRIRSDSGVAS